MNPFHEIGNIGKRVFRRLVITPEAIRNRKDLAKQRGDKKRLLLFADPRGGSTWLASVLERLPRSYLFFEPFNERIHPEIEALGIHRYQYVPEGAEWPRLERFFRELLAPGFLPYSYVRKKGWGRARHYVHKFCFAKFLLPWLVERFPVHPILLVRHPCAVVASQLAHPGWKDWAPTSFPYPEGAYSDFFKGFSDQLDDLEHHEEFLAAMWAIGMKRTLKHAYNDQKWTTIAYEDLYLNPEACLQRLAERHGFELDEGMFDAVRQPSITTARTKQEGAFGAMGQLYSWKEKLTAEQEEHIMKVVQRFGIDAYGLHPLPEGAKVYKDPAMLEVHERNEKRMAQKEGGEA